jgi:putative DNA primase/helicase
VSIRQASFDADPLLLNCSNGTVNLRSGSFQPHARTDFLTRIAPAVYVPGATSPTWSRFLDRIFDGNADLIAFVQRALGYSLTGDVSERAMFILYGAGRNGKSTLVETVARILGDYAATSSADMVSARKGDPGIPVDLARLQGVRFTMASETGEYSRLDEARVKHITGGDRITARYLHRNPFEFDPAFKIWLSTNYQPTIRGVDEGIWDRIRLIPFTVRIPDSEVDRYLKDKLLREAPGILNWMIEGCLAWQQRGLDTVDSVVAATREYRASQDSVGGFLAESCVMDAQSSIPVGELYAAYEEWAKASGEFTVSKRALTNRMRDRGFVIEKMGPRNMMSIQGVRLPFASEGGSVKSTMYAIRH